MSWFNVWDNLKTKTCRYLLQRYLGQFFESKLNLEQLNVELYNGRAVVQNVNLKVEAFNELFEAQGWSFEVISGHIGCLTVVVPWNALMTNDSSLEVSNLVITLRPIKRQLSGTSMLESMWSSASSSMQMAAECMKQSDCDVSYEVHNNTLVGLEKFAETIDNVLNRIQAKCINTVIKVEYTLPSKGNKIVVAMKIDNIEYKNETGCEKPSENNLKNIYETKNSKEDGPKLNENRIPSVAKHNLHLEGVTIFTSENIIFEPSTAYNFHNKYLGPSYIPIIKIKECQNIQIKTKQNENIIGPKISLDIEIGSVFVLLSPRQIHQTTKIINAFFEEEANKTSPKNKMDNGGKKQSELLRKGIDITKMAGVVNNTGNWCSDYEALEKNCSVIQKESYMHSYKESDEASMSNISTVIGCGKYPERCVESSGEILRFRIQISAINAFALHNDIIKQKDTDSIGISNRNINEESYSKCLQFAINFFENIREDFSIDNQSMLDELKEMNFLCFLISPLFFNGNQYRNHHNLMSQAEITATKIDVYEVLNNLKYPLIAFERENIYIDGYPQKAEITINAKSSSSCFPKNSASNTFEIVMKKCTVDVDISIYDRLYALFGSNPFEENNLSSDRVEYNSYSETQISCTLLEMYLRFPIVDVNNDGRINSIWEQKIRKDFLILSFPSLMLKIEPHAISLNSNEINIFYCEGSLSNIVNVLNCKSLKTCSGNISPSISFSTEDNLRATEKVRLPFSSKQERRQSDTAHDFQSQSMDTEDSLLPGETEEIEEFCEKSLQASKLRIKVQLPITEITFESKQLYEILYNRLNSDLFMWEPTLPTKRKLPRNKQNSSKSYAMPPNDIYKHSTRYTNDSIYHKDKLKDNFYMEEKDLIHITSQKDIVEDSIYQSTSETILITNPKEYPENNAKYCNSCAIEICMNDAILKLFVPVRDTDNHVLPGQSGKFEILVKNLKIFSVTDFNNKKNLNYVSLQLDEIDVYHCGLVPILSKEYKTDTMDFMESTFYNIPNNCQQKKQITNRKEAICITIEMRKILEQNIKRLRIATGINNAVLRHNPELVQHTWLNQLIDFLDIQDFPIEGYNPCALITEIQLHFWDCVVDYRPKYLPYRVEIDVGYFTISSNLISSISGCNLRFVVEDSNLAIAPFDNQNKTNQRQKFIFLENSNMVSVLKIGLIDVSLRLNEKKLEKSPKFDLRCSIHDGHLRTCYDSGKALAQLIGYYASDKDVTEGSNESSYLNNDKKTEISKQITNSLTKDDQQHRVSTLVAEALQDEICLSNCKTTPNELSISTSTESELEVFYFPDENLQTSFSYQENINRVEGFLDFESNVMLDTCVKSDNEISLPQVQSDLGNIYLKNKTDSEELEFCVVQQKVEHQKSQCGIQNIQVSEDPLRIVDNHFFFPQDKLDPLQSPPNFPMAEYRYTLCEMTITWHLYDGTDFTEFVEGQKASKSENPQMSDTYKYGISQPKGETNHSEQKINHTYKGRNLDVLVEAQFTKIRFTHEVYPVKSAQASRQVLLITDFEIRDRLRSSDINKFLYHPQVKNLPNKSDEHMLIIKALHVRPYPQQSSAEECSLRISLLPIKLNIDQDTLLFMENFFSNLFSTGQSGSNDLDKSYSNIDQNIPVMNIGDVDEVLGDLKTCKMVEENLDILIDEKNSTLDQEINGDSSQPIFFKEVIFSPSVPICLDYHGRRIELSRGPMTGLLMGLAQLQGSGICLRELTNRRGLLGWNKLLAYLCKEWLKDIKRNQLPNILSGLGPTNAVLQLIQGIYDLFWLPIEQYQKDGRIIRGFQLGAQSFSARTALAALEITSRIINLLQFTAETTFDMLSTGPSVRKNRKHNYARKRHYRPKDLREGMSNAYLIVKEGINDSASKLIETAVNEHDQKGYTGAVGAVMRQIPQLVVCPAVLATQATTNILGGAKSSLLPEAKLEAKEKWKDE